MKQKRSRLNGYLCLLVFLIGSVWIGLPDQAKGQSLLWEISGNGIKESSYLYGTIHILCPDEYKLDKKVKIAIK